MKKQNLCRIAAVILAAVLVFTVCPTALAAPLTIYRENIVNAYIQGDRGGGNWSNLEVREYRTATGNPAYCIQHNITGPGTGGNAYDEMNPYEQLSEYQKNGLQAILLHGYPYSSGGMSEEAGRYVTGLAIRCWLTETGDPNHTYYAYLDRVNYPERMRSTGGSTVEFLDELLGYARAQDVMPSTLYASAMTFSRSTNEPQYYIGSTTITGENVDSWSGEFNGFPAGTVIDGNDGVMGRTVTIKIPIGAGKVAPSINLTGYSNRTTGSVFWLKPSGANLQNIMMADPNWTTEAATTSLTVSLPTGTLTIRKTDSETGAGVGGAVFNVSFAGQPQRFTDNGNGTYTFTASGGTTELKSPASGTITLRDLPGGSYTVSEKTPPSGYIGTGSQNVNITDGTTASLTFQNQKTRIVISKTDKATGKPVQGVTLRLYESDGKTKIGDYTTNAQGKIEIRGLATGKTYKYQEISAPEGYWFDKNKVYTFSISTNGNVSGEISIDNVYTEVTITKTDRINGLPIEGVEIQLYNPDGTEQGKHVTNESGAFTIKGLAPGRYTYKELAAPEGYWFDKNKVYTFTIDAKGNVTGETVIDNVYTEVTILKVDRISSAPIEGVTIELFNPDGSKQGEYTTTSAGEVTIKGLKPGVYTYKEIAAPPQHTFDPEKEYSFTIGEDGSVSGTTEIDNDITQISFIKQDAKTGETLDGLFFRIRKGDSDAGAEGDPDAEYLKFKYDEMRQAYVYSEDDPAAETQFTTQDGKAVLERIPKGSYVLEEVEAFPEYTLADPVEFTIDDSTSTATPLLIEMENEPTRLVLEKQNAVTKELIDGCVFRVAATGVEGITEGEYMPLTWDEESSTYNYDPESGEVDFTTKNGTAVIDYLPKGSYEIEETEYDEEQYLPPQTLPFELDETTSYLNPLDVLFKNWQGYGTIRVYHRRVVTKEHLTDPYYLTRPLDESFEIDPDAMVLKGLPIRYVEVYRTPRHLETDKFAPEVAAALDPLPDDTLLKVDPDYELPSQQAFTDAVTETAQARDRKDAWIDSKEFRITGDYDDQITTIVYWYEDIATPLTESGEPAVNDMIETDGGTPKTGDETDIVIPLAAAIASGAVLGTVFILKKRKQKTKGQ